MLTFILNKLDRYLVASLFPGCFIVQIIIEKDNYPTYWTGL
jgi:hypothetical protein